MLLKIDRTSDYIREFIDQTEGQDQTKGQGINLLIEFQAND